MTSSIRRMGIIVLAVSVVCALSLPDILSAESSKRIPQLEEIERRIDEKVEKKINEKLESKVDEKVETKVDEKIQRELEKKLDREVSEKIEEKVDRKVDQKIKEKVNIKPKPVKVLPAPGDDISPLETEAIDEAGAKIGKKIEQLAERASHKLGHWIDAKVVYGITWLKLGFSLLAIVLLFFVDRLIRAVLRRRIRRIAPDQESVDARRVAVEALRKPLSLFIWVYGVYAALSPLFVHFEQPFGENVIHDMASRVTGIGGGVAAVWLIYRLVRLVDVQLMNRSESRAGKVDELLASIVGKTARMAILAIGGIVIIQNVTGIDIAPLLASLGIGGLAIALAAKEPLANIFGTFTVLFDKPFSVGQRVVIDDHDGVVEAVGYRSTRIRTLDGNLVSIPNQKVINSPVDNVSQRPYIRWVTDIVIPQDTPPLKIERAFRILHEVLDNHEGMHSDLPPRIYLTAFTEWGLNIQITAWYHPPEWWDYQAWVHTTCMRILEGFHAEDIKLAMPGFVNARLGEHAPDSTGNPLVTMLSKASGRAA